MSYMAVFCLSRQAKNGPDCVKRFVKIEVRASTLNLKFIGTSADVDFAQMRNF
ncbi:hypothetical protein ALQ61_04285 [Pseudomonas coronafaciens pv. zizaniae]|nr:hypothetical protein ALQ61_04285 [Pseudomonas coronafaciens pv. zizaniae]